MKKTLKIGALILSFVMLLGVMCGCSSSALASTYLAANDSEQTSSDLVGTWIDQEDDSLVFNADGTCVYFDGTELDSYNFDGKTVTFTYDGENTEYDARLFDEFFVIFWDTNTYTRVSGNTGELLGEWKCVDEGYEEYSFIFNDDNTFVEDGTLNGSYAVQGDEMAFLYDDNTITFNLYDLDGDTLYVMFGWPLTNSTALND